MRNASYVDTLQLQVKEVVLSAIKKHYGNRKMPTFSDKLEMSAIHLFHRKFLGANDTRKFFDQAKDAVGKHNTNNIAVNLPESKVQVFFGMKIRTETVGAGPADNDKATQSEIAPLVFAAPTEVAVLNSNIELEVSKKKIIDEYDGPVGLMLDNIDGINNYIRFLEPVVREPGAQIDLDFRFLSQPTLIYGEVDLVGVELEVKMA